VRKDDIKRSSGSVRGARDRAFAAKRGHTERGRKEEGSGRREGPSRRNGGKTMREL